MPLAGKYRGDMPSQVWGRDPQEAFENPYEYAVQEQFVREAKALFKQCYLILAADRHSYSAPDTSGGKAVWLLHMDALDSLRDALDALERKRHRVAGKLFRTVMESLDLAAYFHSGTADSAQDLETWYQDGFVAHRRFRDHVRKTDGPAAAKQKGAQYHNLSKFVHRSYRAILDGYSLCEGDRLVHDGIGERFGEHERAETILVLPQTIASYSASLADLVLEFLSETVRRGTTTEGEVSAVLESCFEGETVKRRFMPRTWFRKMMRAQIEDERQAAEESAPSAEDA